VDEVLVKTHASDTEKIATIIDLVGGAIDVDRLLARLKETRGEAGRGHPPASQARATLIGRGRPPSR
nr:hypothetical protein [Chloroflexota bacterium]